MKYRELLDRLTTMDWLALSPDPQEQSGCMSSYDRASRYDEAADCYRDWDANDDGTGCVRRLEDGSIVAFECEGPGVIWRVWSALPKQGHMRIYFDGEETPTVDLPFIDWFESQPGDIPPLNLSELSTRLSRGRNSFIPIPFQHSCRVELAPGWGSYYHFTYTRFSEGTQMPLYTERFTNDGMIALAEADRALYDRGEATDGNAVTEEARILPGQTVCLHEQEGAGCIRQVTLYPQTLTDVNWTLRQLVLRIYWDGRSRPAVEAPLGDFFGGAPGYARFRCLPVSMERAAYSFRFPMPFARGCRVEVANMGSEAQRVRLALEISREAPDESSMRFHAKWHRGFYGDLDPSRFAPGADRWPDWPLLLIQNACGRFCGVHFHICNTWKSPAQPAQTWWYGQWDRKSVDWWWGEGDEKFFVDGEKFPSTFGTGSEDYIGYAWAAEPPFARFDSAYACMNAMPIDGNGHTSVSRFQIADSVPFRHRFEAFIEKYKSDVWDGGGRCLYAVTPYWYQQADTDDGYPAIRPEELLAGYED